MAAARPRTAAEILADLKAAQLLDDARAREAGERQREKKGLPRISSPPKPETPAAAPAPAIRETSHMRPPWQSRTDCPRTKP